MKKFFLLILSIILMIVIITMSGCSDFGFNPTGQWQFVSDDLYADDVQIDSARAEDSVFLSNMIMIFEKSGTGYINAGGIKTSRFRYSYNNETVTVTFESNEYTSQETVVEFKLSENGKKLIRTDITHKKDNEGHEITYREEYIYSRI